MRSTRVIGALVCAAALVAAAPAAADTTVLVQEADVARQPENTPPTRNWVIYNRNAGAAAFRFGPAGVPLGAGSLELSTPTGADKITAFNFDHVGTPLAAIDALGYANYRSAGQLQQTTALNLQVDVNGAAPGGFTTLVYEPVYNGTVVSGTWQTWDAYDGGDAIWWSSNPIPSAPNRDTFVSWDTIVAANPDAVVAGGYGLNQGSGNPGLVGANDALEFGVSGDTTTYDFDVRPASKDDCKKDGWKAYGPVFKNQGDCVSAVASAKG